MPDRTEALDLAVDALAVYRLTRLVTADVITQPLRDRLIEAAYANAGWSERMRAMFDPKHEGDWQAIVGADEDPPKLATLVTCRWCAGVWVGIGVVAARSMLPRAWRPMATGLALSAAGALIAGLERD